MYFVYIVECNDGSLYTGIALDVVKRVKLHNSGKGAKYTALHKPVHLRYIEPAGSRAEAMLRERQIKKFPRKQKLALLAENM